LQAFVAALLEVPKLYPYSDPLGSLNVNVFQPGQQLGWHYDNADWAFTLMLQDAEAGGVYEYLPWTRSASEENYDRVARVLDGEEPEVRKLSMGAGALVLFRGRHSIHRVTPVEGNRPRLVAVLSYDTEPGVMLTEHNRKLFYGRAS
jgi:predicted 2-oxoglutarate/Fe(II)-dependent dioxygenase YbiX